MEADIIVELSRLFKKRFARAVRFTSIGRINIMRALSRYGGIAQLGERLHGMQEVSGSIPLTSTNSVFQEVQ